MGFHEQAFFSFGGFEEVRARRDELAGRRGADGDARGGGDLFEELLLVPVVRLHRDELGRAVAGEVLQKGGAELRGVAQFPLVHIPSVVPQFGREGPEGGEVENAFHLVGGTGILRLDEKNDIGSGCPRSERRVLQRQLVLENKERSFRRRHGATIPARRAGTTPSRSQGDVARKTRLPRQGGRRNKLNLRARDFPAGR